MQSRWSITAFSIAACLCCLGSVIAQDGAAAPGNCGCEGQGTYAVEGCLKGWEIRQADAEALWNGYCEGDCRVGHSKEGGTFGHGHNCGGGCGANGACGCGACGRLGAGGCNACGNGIGAGLRSGGRGTSTGGLLSGHGRDCGCDACAARGTLRSGSGLNLGAGLRNRGCDTCGTNGSSCDSCDAGPAMPSAGSCGSWCGGLRTGMNFGFGHGLAGRECGCGGDSCNTCKQRPSLWSGLGNRNCDSSHGLGIGSRLSCGGDANCGGECFGWPSGCGNGCGFGSGHFHGFGLGSGRGCGNRWDDMCAKEPFNDANACGCSK